MLDRRRVGGLGTLLAAGALVLGACSDDGGNDAGAASRGPAVPAVTTTTVVSDSTALCAIFTERAANGAGPGAQFEASTPAGWERRIETTRKIVDAAPVEWRDEAETYLQMVKDRAQLAAENGYVGVNDLPADVRDTFISSHRELQAEVNELIAYMSSECRTPTEG